MIIRTITSYKFWLCFFCDKEPKQQWQYIVAISYHYCCIRCIQLFFAKFSLFCTKVWCSNTVLLRFGQSLQLGLSAYKRIMQWINGYRTHPKVIFVLSILHPHTIFKQLSTCVVCIDVGVVISTLWLFTSFKKLWYKTKSKEGS